MAVVGMALNPAAHAATDVYLGLQAYGSSGKPLGVGLASFTAASSDPESSTWAQSLRSVLREDLLFEGLFSLSEGGPVPAADKIDALAWSGLGAQVLITGEAKVLGGNVELSCKIYDVGTSKVLFLKEGSGTKAAARRLAHLLADQLTFQLTGQPGIAHTRVAFVSNRSRHKEIYVMDYDGQNLRQMTSDRSIALLPKWSPDGQELVFNSYRAHNPDAFFLAYPAGTLRNFSTRQGLNTAPAWSPDGQTLAVTISKGGDPELYLLDRAGQIVRRLTYSAGVDTSPFFSPNGQQIVFVSDRAGNPELYLMDVSGSRVQRLTYGQWVDAPAWSPRGDWIAYQRQRSQGQYDIFVIDSAGKNNHALTEAQGRNESPSWSPDGRFIIFTSNRDDRRRLYIMGADGSNPHPVGELEGEFFDPSWGP